MKWEALNIDLKGRNKGKVKVYCPQCRDTRSDKQDRSLSVDIDAGLFKCHYCSWAGSAAEKEDNEWRKPVRMQAKEYKKPEKVGSSELSEKVVKYFSGRGISVQTLQLMGVTEGLEYMPQKSAEVNTVQFNYYLNGEHINTKYRTADKHFKLTSGAELLPYNVDAIFGASTVIVTEGEIDALSWIEIGVQAVVSVPNGASANLSYLDAYIESHFGDKETIYIAVDEDTKGEILKNELIRRFGAERCRIIEYGDGCKDSNEHLIKYGRESLLKCLEEAKEVKIEGVFTVKDFEQSLDALFEDGLKPGATIGHRNFDALCSFETRRLCTVTGTPSAGKSEVIDMIAERLNIRYGWRFAFFSPENAPLQYHASKLIEKFTGKKFKKGHLPEQEYLEVKEHLENNFFFISPSSFTVENILSAATSLVRRKGIKCLVIDPFNRVELPTSNKSETNQISEFLDKLTNFAQVNDVLVILMAHPAKRPRNKDGTIEAPNLYDISGSANFYNKSDYGIIIHRNYAEDLTEVHVQKVKFRNLGQAGIAQFKYNLNNGRYTPVIDGVPDEQDNTNHLRKSIKDPNQNEQRLIPFEYDSGDIPF
ncbi:MAG: toprim domain-containing protein [Leadbetterella sp.]|nr:toprim domain-containing protein [Leadbetterella sp.]